MSNRVQPWLEDFPGFIADEFSPKDGYEANQSFPHVLFSPLHYEPKYAYPLIIWLHGPNQSERQLLDVMPMISLRNYVAIAPQGMNASDDAGTDDRGWPTDANSVLQAESLIFGCLQRAQQQRQIAARKIFLAGEGEGGTMALRIALANPRTFAGVVSVEGEFPKGNNPLAQVSESRCLPIWIASSRDSQTYPVEEACSDLRLLHSAGMHITMRQYPNTETCLRLALPDLNTWLMELVSGTSR